MRDICREARANVAAVNYHFGDKPGLYARCSAGHRNDEGHDRCGARAGAGRPPEEKLAPSSASFRGVSKGARAWIHQLMMQELADPTPALDIVVDQVLRPRMAYLAEIIARLIECREDDPRVARCLMSVQAQIHARLVRNPIADRLVPDRPVTADGVAAIARHITRFSLAGIRATAAA